MPIIILYCNYFKLNEKININNLSNIYSKESIYILNYPEDNNVEVSYGKLSYLNNTEIFYQCNIKEGSSGSPILLINNQKLIGVHNYNSKKYKYYKTKI